MQCLHAYLRARILGRATLCVTNAIAKDGAITRSVRFEATRKGCLVQSGMWELEAVALARPYFLLDTALMRTITLASTL